MCSCNGLNYVFPQTPFLWIWPSLFVNKVFGDVIKLTRSHRRLGFPDSSVGKESSCNAGDPGSIPGLGRSTGEGMSYPLQYSWTSLVAQLVKNLPAMWETWVWFLGWEDSPGEGKGNPLQYSGLENSMDCIGHGVTKSETRLSNFHFTSIMKGQNGGNLIIILYEVPSPSSSLTLLI